MLKLVSLIVIWVVVNIAGQNRKAKAVEMLYFYCEIYTWEKSEGSVAVYTMGFFISDIIREEHKSKTNECITKETF